MAQHSPAPASRRRAIQPHCSTRSIRISRHNMADWRKHPTVCMVDSDPSMNVKTVDTVSDLFRVRPLQGCPGALSPAKRSRLFWLSWRHAPAPRGGQVASSMYWRSLQRTNQKKSAGFTKVGRARRSPGCQRSPDAFRYNASPVFPGTRAISRKTKTSFHQKYTDGRMAWHDPVCGGIPL